VSFVSYYITEKIYPYDWLKAGQFIANS